MLIRFSVENWMSFKEQAVFSMLATQEKQHKERVIRPGGYRPNLLPVAAVYGGNAAGKTNLFKALNFAKNFVLIGTPIGGMIGSEPFRLHQECLSKPSRFGFMILVGDKIYEYAFALTQRNVVEEKLVCVKKASEEVLFHRMEGDRNGHFAPKYAQDNRLQVIFEGTRNNALFLPTSVSLQIEYFKPIYDWFYSTLELVGPDSRFEPFDQFIDENNRLYAMMNDLLPQFDTGIHRICGESVPLDSIPFPNPMLKQWIRNNVKYGFPLRMRMPANELFVFSRDVEDGEVKAHKLITMHKGQEGTDIRFEMRQESDGSQRMIDLMPVFVTLAEANANKVYVIDEIDRSLHSVLTRSLLEMYLNTCSATTRKQLLFTTHDVTLMDQNLLRRDEMWVTERSQDGESTLIAICEYKGVRSDNNLRGSYLKGRFGGIPNILMHEVMEKIHTQAMVPPCDEDSK